MWGGRGGGDGGSRDTVPTVGGGGGGGEGDGGEGGMEGGGSPWGSTWSRSRLSRCHAEGEPAAWASENGARRFVAPSAAPSCSVRCCSCGHSLTTGGGGGDVVVVDSSECALFGGHDASRAHRLTANVARSVAAFSISLWCAAARALLRCCLVDGSRTCESLASPLAGLTLASGLAFKRFSLKSVYVTVPSTCTRNECIFISSASVAARRTARRVALLEFHRAAGLPGACIVGKPSEEDRIK